MATITQRPGKNGHVSYRVEVRRKGTPPQSASFQTLAEARKWATIREGAVLEGRHFPSTAAKRHTVSDLIDRYLTDVLPDKASGSFAFSEPASQAPGSPGRCLKIQANAAGKREPADALIGLPSQCTRAYKKLAERVDDIRVRDGVTSPTVGSRHSKASYQSIGTSERCAGPSTPCVLASLL